MRKADCNSFVKVCIYCFMEKNISSIILYNVQPQYRNHISITFYLYNYIHFDFVVLHGQNLREVKSAYSIETDIEVGTNKKQHVQLNKPHFEVITVLPCP